MDKTREQWNNLYDKLIEIPHYFDYDFKDNVINSESLEDLLRKLDNQHTDELTEALDGMSNSTHLSLLEVNTEYPANKSRFQEIVESNDNFISTINSMKKIVEFYTNDTAIQPTQCRSIAGKSRDKTYLRMMENVEKEYYCSSQQAVCEENTVYSKMIDKVEREYLANKPKSICENCKESHLSHNNVFLKNNRCDIIKLPRGEVSAIVAKAKDLIEDNNYICNWEVKESIENGEVIYSCIASIKSTLVDTYLPMFVGAESISVNESINLVSYKIIKYITEKLNSTKA